MALAFNNNTALVLLVAAVALWWFCTQRTTLSHFDPLSVENGNVTLTGSKLPASVTVGGLQPAGLGVVQTVTPMAYFDERAAGAYAEFASETPDPRSAAAPAVATNQPMPVATVPVDVPAYRVHMPTAGPTNAGAGAPAVPMPEAADAGAAAAFFSLDGADAGTTVSTALSTGPLMTISATSTTGAPTLAGANAAVVPAGAGAVQYNTLSSVDYPGNDIQCSMYQPGALASPAPCQTQCSGNAQCAGYVSVAPGANAVIPSGFCCSKRAMVDPMASAGVSSFVKMNLAPQ